MGPGWRTDGGAWTWLQCIGEYWSRYRYEENPIDLDEDTFVADFNSGYSGRGCADNRSCGRAVRGVRAFESVLCAEHFAISCAAVRQDQGHGLSAGDRGRHCAGRC